MPGINTKIIDFGYTPQNLVVVGAIDGVLSCDFLRLLINGKLEGVGSNTVNDINILHTELCGTKVILYYQ